MSERKIAGRRFEWESLGAALSFVAAALTGLLGILLTTSWIVIPALHPQLRDLGILFLIVALPLLICGGHCLDLLERRRKREREATLQPPQRGSITISCIVAAAILVGLAFIAPLELWAQQTIFNVPTTDVLDRGKVYAELDVSFKPTDSSSVNQFASFVPRVVVGTGGNVEIGLNVTGNIQPGADTTTLVPAAKWKLYNGKDSGWAFVAGNNLFIPVRNKSYRAGNYFYAEISKTFKSGTRITAGGYDFTKNVVSTANRAGGQFAFEQPLNSKVTFAADWYTGKHSSGYFTPGIIFKPAPKVIGKQLLMTRGALTTFSIANDVAKYFAIIPAMFAGAFPVLNALNIMGLRTPESAILSAVIFNALIIIALIPLALKGVKYRAMSAAALLRRNLLIYGLGGVIAPFVGIKIIDVIIHAVGLA